MRLAFALADYILWISIVQMFRIYNNPGMLGLI